MQPLKIDLKKYKTGERDKKCWENKKKWGQSRNKLPGQLENNSQLYSEFYDNTRNFWAGKCVYLKFVLKSFLWLLG